jgi:large subunit ribosomal protein L29
MKGPEVHQLADEELVQFVANSRSELFNLRFQHATGQLENTGRLKDAKKDLARGLTVAHERGIDIDTAVARQAND